MTHSDFQDDPTGPAMADPLPVPANEWTLAPGASIVVYRQKPPKQTFDVVLLSVDPALLEEGDRSFIVRGATGVDRRQLPFSLRAGTGAAYVLAGRFEGQVLEQGAPHVVADWRDLSERPHRSGAHPLSGGGARHECDSR